MAEPTSAQEAAEKIKRYVDESNGDEIALRVIARLITDSLGGGWQPCTTPPIHDGVEDALLLMSRYDPVPRRAYFKNEWRDSQGRVIENVSDSYWMQVPPLPERRFGSLDELRDAFIVDTTPAPEAEKG